MPSPMPSLVMMSHRTSYGTLPQHGSCRAAPTYGRLLVISVCPSRCSPRDMGIIILIIWPERKMHLSGDAEYRLAGWCRGDA